MNKNQLVENDICPNCWGEQEYDGLIKKAAKDRQVDINNHNSESTRAFIQRFTVKHLDGIRLRKQGDFKECPLCKARF